ncbi:MAG: M13 family metallopeptidase [Proteobacteria bacterium]|nr:M13 family metallopeptidase [Pseudomonadota bacterium]
MNKTIAILVTCAFLLAACDRGGQPTEEVKVSPYATASGIDFSGFDNSVNPADDFFNYVNGTWLAETEIPGDSTSYGSFRILRDESEANQRAIIEELSEQDNLAAGSIEQKIGDFYASLLNKDLVEGKGTDPLKPYFEKISAIENTADLMRTFGGTGYTGVNAPLGTAVFPDLGDSSRYMAYVWQGGLALPGRDYYLNEGEKFDEIRAAYPLYIASLFEMAGFDNAAGRAQNVIGIEMQIAENHWSPVQNRDIPALYNLFNTANLDEEVTSEIDWQAFFEGAGLTGREELVVAQLSYFQALGGIINGASLDAWKDYLRFQTMNGEATFLSSEFKDAHFNFMGKLVNGLEEQPERWKTGVRVINATLGEGVGRVYVDRHFPPEAKVALENRVINLMAAFQEVIQELNWMSDETKAMAEEKRSKMMTKIGYPDEWRDYSALEIIAGDNFGNIRRAIAFEYSRSLAKLGTPVDKKEWGMTPQTVNAYYSPSKNEIVFPAARLQPPFFQLDADDAINYGAVGGVIGHEISHGFDDSGSQFDGDGNLVNWWSDDDRAAFEERTKVLVEQYEQFSPVEGMHVNGELTLGENIGDLSGVAMAYRAYVRSLNGEEAPVIDGFTGAQRFFIGYAMSRKGKYQDEALINRLASDPHSPLEFRVNGPYRNIDAFHEAFGTQEGDGMWLAPEDRVRIW